MGRPTLPDEVKIFIVQALACFDSPQTVVNAVAKEFELTLSRQLVERYDPTKRAGAGMAKKWAVLFEKTRKKFQSDTSSLGIAHRTTRLRTLQRLADKAEAQGALALTASLLEQAAKEMGDSYSNRHKLEHTGAGGGPMQVATTPLEPAARAARIAELAARTGVFKSQTTAPSTE